ncbi:MAG TPA: cytochrome c [Thermoanaerobaculia bacterium]|jgi:cytochrome c551/c552
MTKKLTLTVVLSLLLGLAVAAAPLAAEESDGKAVFEAQKCNLCHAVPPAGIEATTKSDKLKGPDLVNLDSEAEWLAQYLKKEVDKDGKSHTKPFKGSDEELTALVDWLLEQKSE